MSGITPQLLESAGGVPITDELSLPGGQQIPLVAPTDEAGFVALVNLARRDGLSLLPVGNGSWLANERAPTSVDFAVSTRSFAGIVSYEPGDGTVTARPGTTLAAIGEATRAGGHSVTPDVAHPTRSTLGGVIASGRSGFDRLRRGPTRHHVLGTRALLADGTIANSGGRLVKNVTGYDLHRLYCGSRGSLCILMEASLRLFPRAEDERVLSLETAALEEALAAAERVLAQPFEPFTVRVLDSIGGVRLEAYFGGRTPVVDASVERLSQQFPRASWLAGDDAVSHRTSARDSSTSPTFVIAARPSELAPALDALRGLFEAGAECEIHPGLAEVRVRLPGASPSELDDAVTRSRSQSWRQHLSPSARTSWLYAPSEATARAPRGLALMQRLRDALDPTGVFARGRFTEGL